MRTRHWMRHAALSSLLIGWGCLAGAGASWAGPAGAREDPNQPQDPPPPADTRTTDDKVEEIDQRLKILERQQEPAKEKDAGKAKPAPAVGAGRDGITIRSADGAFQLRIRGYLQTDNRFFNADHVQPGTDTFLLRRARPIFEATVYRIFDLKLMPDFGEGKTVLQEAYMEARFAPFLGLRAGKYKAPFGLERLQSARDLLFVERALPTNLVPNRDIGLQLQGEFRRGAIAYAAGFFNGISDGGSADTDINDSKEGAARLFVQPFRNAAAPAARGLGFGVSATFGNNAGTAKDTGLSGYKSAGQQTFFSYLSSGLPAGTVVADGRRTRWSPQAYYYAGRFGLQAERVISSQEVALPAAAATLRNAAWQASASILLTPDKASWTGVDPKKPFDPAQGGWGAFEVAVRAGRLAVDREAFPNFADPARSARAASERAVGVNWYLNRGVRFMFDYSWTRFEGGAAGGGDRESERVLLSRFQIAF